MRGIKNANWNQFLFGLITIAPPLFILLFTALLLTAIGLFFNPIYSAVLVGGLLVFFTTIIWTLYLSNVPSAIWKAIWGLPIFIFKQITALFKMSDPNKNFKHSEHTRTVKIDDLAGM